MRIFKKNNSLFVDVWATKPRCGYICFQVDEIEYVPIDMQVILHINRNNIKRIILHLQYIDLINVYGTSGKRVSSWTVYTGWSTY